MNKLKKYEKNINRVLTYICQNITEELKINNLVDISKFSKFHFLRMFKAITGETLGEFIRRMRLEKAAYQLIYNPLLSITEIAFNLNFSSSQNFAKAFKNRFKTSPTDYRLTNINKKMSTKSNPGNNESNDGKDTHKELHYNQIIEGTRFRINLVKGIHKHVQVKEIPDMCVATMTKTGHYTPKMITSAITDLIEWAVSRGLTKSGKIFCTFWDSAAVTPVDKQKFDACITIPENYKTGSLVNKKIIKGSKYAVYSCNVDNYDFYYHWNKFLREWFPISGYQPAEGPSFEFYKNILYKPVNAIIETDICIPIKDL